MRFIAFALLGLAILFILPGIGDRDFWPGDEARYGGVARDMSDTDNYAIPHLNGEIYGDKPPGYFWAVHAAAWVTGDVDEGSSRWPAAFAAIVLVILAGVASARCTGAHAGFLTGMFLLATHSFAWQARFAQLDLLFSMFIALSALCGFRSLEENKPRLMTLSFVWLGLAMLVKGPLALLVLPLLALWRVIGRPAKEEGVRYKSALIVGFLLFVLPTLLWLVCASQVDGGLEYIEQDLLKRNIVDRSQHGLAHVRPWHFYLKRLPINLAPWILILPVLFLKQVRNLLGRQGRRLCGFSIVWVLFFLLLQSAFPGKRNVYTFIFYVPLAILFGHAAAAAVSEKADGLARAWTGIVAGLVSLILLIAGALIVMASQDVGIIQGWLDLAEERLDADFAASWRDLMLPVSSSADYGEFIRDMRMIALPMVATGLAAFVLICRRRLDVGLDTLMIGMACVLGLLFTLGAPWMDANRSRRSIAERTLSVVGDRPLAIFRHTDEGILWYCGGRLPELTGDVPVFDPDTGRKEREAGQHAAAEIAAQNWLGSQNRRFLLIRRKDRARLESLKEGRDYVLVSSERVGSKRWYDLIRSTRGG